MFHVPQPFPHLGARKGGAQVGGCLVSMSLTDCFFTMAVLFLESSLYASWIYQRKFSGKLPIYELLGSLTGIVVLAVVVVAIVVLAFG